MLQIDSLDDLMALNRALMEARYLARDVDWATRGSALLSEIHQRVVNAIIESHDSAGEPQKADSWRKWREFPTRAIEQIAIVEYLKEMWPRLQTSAAKREAVENQMRPFMYSGSDAQGMVARIEAAVSE
jgi:hypothetical protein